MKEEKKSQPIDNKQNKSGATCTTLGGRGKITPYLPQYSNLLDMLTKP